MTISMFLSQSLLRSGYIIFANGKLVSHSGEYGLEILACKTIARLLHTSIVLKRLADFGKIDF